MKNKTNNDSSHNNINILIIESKTGTTAAKQFQKILPGEQYHFHVAKNHREAIKKLSNGDFEIVISEEKAHGIKDVELIKQIKDLQSKLCFIVTSGFPSIKDALNSLKAGAYDYIPLPFDEEAVKIILSKAIERQQLYKERDRYKELSNLDGLTELYNHRHVHELLDIELSRTKRYHRTLALIMIDIDNFKKFNDTYGHLEGDRLLKNVSKFFMQNIRNIDYACRYGGEEFTIILPETGKKGAFNLCRRLRSSLVSSVYKNKQSAYKFKPTISIGLSCYPIDTKIKNALIKSADMALYEAKRLGKNRICIYTPVLEKKTK